MSGGRWLRWALVGSLALNLMLIGLFAGTALRGWGGEAPVGPGLVGYARALPEGHRRELMREFRRGDAAWEEGRAAMARAHAALRAALVAEPFEVERLRAALAEQRAAQAAMGDRAAALLAGRIERMTPKERAALAERLGRQERHGPGRGGGRAGGPPRP